MRTCAETDVAFILKVSFVTVIPRIGTQLRIRAVASFTAVGVAFSTFQKEGKQTAAKSSENASVCVLPLLRCTTVPSSMQHNKARCILVLGLHMVLSASPRTVLYRCKLSPVCYPTAKTSHLTVPLMSDQLGRGMQPAPPRYGRRFQLHARR